MSLKDQISTERIPKHVAIIMDGNGRWAKQKGNQRIYGHKFGINSVKQAVEAAGEIGIKYLTLYAFSTENWNRPKLEVDALMGLFVSTINSEIGSLQENNVKLTIIGDKESLPESVQNEMQSGIEQLANNTGLNLVIAISYSSRWEIMNAVKKMAQDVKNQTLEPENITENTFTSYLTTADIPDPELLIRTSGEYRISNFLLWQIAYTELYFTDVLWPDFTKEDLYEAILNYQKRERRFGKTSEQIQ